MSAAAPTPEEVASPELPIQIIAIDVGQGDSTLVVGPEVDDHRVTMLIDAGDNRAGIDGSAYVGALLEELGVTALDYVVLSHYDADHMGGFVTIGQGSNSLLWTRSGPDTNVACTAKPLFPWIAIFDVGDPIGSSRSRTEWRACTSQLASTHPEPASSTPEHVEVRNGAHIGRELSLGGDWTATIVAGGGYVLGGTQQVSNVNTANELSIAVLIANGSGFEFLVTGDLIGQPAGAEDALLEPALARGLAQRGVDLEVLRIGHHGAANATAPVFITSTRPEVAIISTGDNNRYEHPRCETLRTLAAGEVEVFQTEAGEPDCGELPSDPHVANGDIEIVARGTSYTVGSRSQPASRVTNAPTERFAIECSLQGCASNSPAAEETSECCRICRTSVACGDGCISVNHQCHQEPGCACNAED
ncbi:MAG: ComEC/Rec2 family competence protein [Sandaracinaceae bacterium]